MSRKLEAGQYYRTRCGRKAYIAAIVGGNPFAERQTENPAIGYVAQSGQVEWMLSGRYFYPSLDGAVPEHEFDIVAEWENE